LAIPLFLIISVPLLGESEVESSVWKEWRWEERGRGDRNNKEALGRFRMVLLEHVPCEEIDKTERETNEGMLLTIARHPPILEPVSVSKRGVLPSFPLTRQPSLV
jgi:hypothetical protein